MFNYSISIYADGVFISFYKWEKLSFKLVKIRVVEMSRNQGVQGTKEVTRSFTSIERESDLQSIIDSFSSTMVSMKWPKSTISTAIFQRRMQYRWRLHEHSNHLRINVYTACVTLQLRNRWSAVASSTRHST
ncbi:hypothetical protein MRB53_027834 [Persea americana]|uniref:Uncharacterized protein n=1 Tax=Persea americana TaxID=3435 RepID=A0ACC2KDT2_PERAE|nr:hypothetical protein MRB53_027834 [Persea americana]